MTQPKVGFATATLEIKTCVEELIGFLNIADEPQKLFWGLQRIVPSENTASTIHLWFIYNKKFWKIVILASCKWIVLCHKPPARMQEMPYVNNT